MKHDSLNLTAPHTLREMAQADTEAGAMHAKQIATMIAEDGYLDRNTPAAQKLGEWDALKEFKERAEFARKAYQHVCGDIAGRVPTVGKHQAVNHEHLRRIYVEAKDAFPQFADTLAWMLWHEIVSFDRLVILVEDFTISTPAQIGGAA